MKIAFASGKGGTGKTTLATNFSSYLAETQPTVLVDLDVEEPNSGLFISGTPVLSRDMFKMIPRWEQESCTLCGQCQTVCNFNAVLKMRDMVMVFPELCHGCYACSEMCPEAALPMTEKKMGELRVSTSGALTFVESRLIIGEEQAVPLIRQTICVTDDEINENGEAAVVVYDSPPGTSCPVIEVVRNADIVILVTEPTPFGLHDLKLAVETVRELDKPFAVVLNRHGIGNDGVERYCAAEHIDIIATIPNDRKIAEAYARGSLLYQEMPPVKRAVMRIRRYAEGMGVTGR